MIVKQKRYEISCNKYTELFNSPDKWDFYCISKDSWLAGYKKCREDVLLEIETNKTIWDEIQEIDIGNPQIGMNDKYNNRDKEKLLKDVLSLHFGAKDIRIHKDNEGNISFQGIL